jgi:hypothetical protein
MPEVRRGSYGLTTSNFIYHLSALSHPQPVVDHLAEDDAEQERIDAWSGDDGAECGDGVGLGVLIPIVDILLRERRHARCARALWARRPGNGGWTEWEVTGAWLSDGSPFLNSSRRWLL